MQTFRHRSDGRENNFDALRLFFAVAVIFGHSYMLSRFSQREPISRFSRGATYSGSIAVAGFFVISGFLITKSWLSEPKLLPYLRKRSLRIFPGYIVAVLLSIYGVAAVVTPGFAHYQGQLLMQATQMSPLFSPGTFVNNPRPHDINGSLWTIRYEFYCYLVVAALGIAGLLRFRGVYGLLALGSIALVGAQEHWKFLGYNEIFGIGQLAVWPGFLACFAVGMAFCAYRNWIPYSLPLLIVCLGALLLLMRLGKPTLTLAALPLLLAYIVFYIAFSNRIRLHHFGKWGDFSYGTYLYAFPIQQLFIWRFGGIQPMILFVAATPLSLGAAYLSWHLVEKPSLAMKGRSSAGKRIPPIQPRVSEVLPTATVK
jgi:peptidoglycan/LPS O-acetylase OafA/YrhL